jgi:hypothetical protein
MWQDYSVCHAYTCRPLYEIVFLLKCTVHFRLVISLYRLESSYWTSNYALHTFFFTTVMRHTGADSEEQWTHNWPKSSNLTEVPVGRSVWRSKRGIALHGYREKTAYWKCIDVLRVTFKRQSTGFSSIPYNNEKLLGIKTRQDISNITEI